MNDERATASVRVTAAEKILDRGYGRSPQLTTTDAGQFRRVCDMTEDELAAMIAGVEPAQPVSVEPEAARCEEDELTRFTDELEIIAPTPIVSPPSGGA